MGAFHDTLGGWDADAELPDDWRDSISRAYDEDFSGAVAKTTELETQLNDVTASSAAEIAKLKAANYDLVMKIPRSESDSTDIIDNDDSDTQITVDDLFGNEN